MNSDVRLRRLRALMRKRKLQGVLATSDAQLRYLTGFTGGHGYLWVTANRAQLFVETLYVFQAEYEVDEDEIDVVGPLKGQGAFITFTTTAAKTNGVKRIGIDRSQLTIGYLERMVKDLRGRELAPFGPELEKLRAVKDADERILMKRAGEIAAQAFQDILPLLVPGTREKQVADALEIAMRARGAEKSSFDTIVASGIRSALPHGLATEKIIDAGDLIVLDFGAYVHGYCSDISRTVVIGRATDRQKKIFQIVTEAQKKGCQKVKPGIKCGDIDKTSRDIVTRAGYGKTFCHSTGHGVGLQIHEEPRVGAGSPDVLEPHMVVTVEPGIYLPGWGGVRIEDTLLVTAKGSTILTDAPRIFEVNP